MKDLMMVGWNNGKLRFRKHVFDCLHQGYKLPIYRYLSRLEVKHKDRKKDRQIDKDANKI